MRSALGDLEADLLALELGPVEVLDGALSDVGIDLDKREAVQDADVVDRLVGEDGALLQRPAQRLLVDAAALAAVDEELGGVGLLAVAVAVAVGLGRRLAFALRLLLPLAFAPRGALAAARRRRMLQPLLRGLPLADLGFDVALDAGDLVLLVGRNAGDRAAGPPHAAGAADAVDVGLRGVRHGVVDDVGDVVDVTRVINYDVPNSSETYVHRIGRTGRVGRTG